jgi:hypothetical protein
VRHLLLLVRHAFGLSILSITRLWVARECIPRAKSTDPNESPYGSP